MISMNFVWPMALQRIIVDTCAGEFEAKTPYYYSSYETYDEVRDSDNKKVMILGGGPNRIGQGIIRLLL